MRAGESHVLLVERSQPTLLSGTTETGKFAAFSAPCPESDQPNEDAAAVFGGEGTTVVAVVDGFGGGRLGHVAARLTLEALDQQLGDGEALAGDARSPILDAIEAANTEIRALGVGAATTLAAIEVRGRTLRPYHVGDSSIVVFGGRGKVKFASVPHSPVGYGVEAGLIDSEEALHHDDLNVVSNLLGNPDMRIELGAPLELSQRDTVVLGTDGLFDNVRVNELFDSVRARDLETAAETLAALARQRMDETRAEDPSKPDDLTFVIYRPSRVD